MIEIDKIDFEKMNGLIPAIIVDINTGFVLMLGFMNREALAKTLDSGKVTFYSRERKTLWTKGETSGNYLILKNILTDCDNDTVLVYAEPMGNTCHTGEYSCFNLAEKENIGFLNKLYDLIKSRKIKLPANSYTTKLFQSGENRIIQKVGEESVEVIIAAKNDDRKEIIEETSDLLFHLLVLLAEKKIEFSEVVENLIERHYKS